VIANISYICFHRGNGGRLILEGGEISCEIFDAYAGDHDNRNALVPVLGPNAVKPVVASNYAWLQEGFRIAPEVADKNFTGKVPLITAPIIAIEEPVLLDILNAPEDKMIWTMKITPSGDGSTETLWLHRYSKPTVIIVR